MSTEDLKTCYTCKEEKPRSEFNRKRANKDGLRKQCRECQYVEKRLWRKNNPEKWRQQRKRYRKSQPAAVYKIQNTITGHIYIGQSTTYVRRCADHKSHLRRNKHKNHKLQEDHNKYGLDAFEFKIIKEFPPDAPSDILLQEEARIISEHLDRGENLYNERLTNA